MQEDKLKVLRDLKNQIIGNRTKKLVFLKLGAVPAVVGMLSSSFAVAGQGRGVGKSEFHECVLSQSAAAIGSSACGLDAGVKAVLDEGDFPLLLSLISHFNENVADAGARSLKMIYQSKLAPKFDFFQEKNMEFLLSLLTSENENITGLGLSIISYSCQRDVEQQALSEAGVVRRLVGLLGGSLTQRDASLESLVAVFKKNPEIARKFVVPGNGGELNAVIELTKDKHPQTRLLACICVVDLSSLVPCLQDSVIKNKLVLVLRDLIDDCQVRDEAPYILSDLIAQKEDIQKCAFDANVIEKLCENLNKGSPSAKSLQGILLALSDLCSKLECCRDRVLNLEVLNFLKEALSHDSAAVRAAFCTLLKNVARSVKNLRAGHFMNENVVPPLVQLLLDSSTSVQAQKPLIIRYEGLKQLVGFSQSMESAVSAKALRALKNLAFLVDNRCKEEILLELSTSTLASLISDPGASVQEHALALTHNLVDGILNSIECLWRGWSAPSCYCKAIAVLFKS